MTEELKIIITAATAEAKKRLADVKKELNGIENTSQEAGATVDAAMKGMAKGALVAIAAIGALTAAMIKLGQSAQDLQKGFDKLTTTFANAGMSAQQATDTYKELFGFLGDHDKAIETAQSLALITSEEKELAEWSNILMGAFAEMGDKLPIEGLAEAANETINVGQTVGVMADALTWAGISEDAFNQALANTTSLSEREALVRNTLNGLYSNSAQIYRNNHKATIDYNTAQASLNTTLARLSSYLTPLLTSLLTLGNVMLTVLGPAIQVVAIYLTAFIQLIAEAIQWVGSFFGMFGSSAAQSTADLKGYQSAMSSYMSGLQNYFGKTNDETNKTNKNIEKLKKQVMGFDELNIVSNPAAVADTTGGGGGGGGLDLGAMPAAPNPSDFGLDNMGIDLTELQEDLETAKERIKAVLTLVGLVAAGLAAWKIAGFISDLRSALSIMKTLKGVDIDANWNSMTGDEQWAVKYTDNLKAQMKSIGGQALITAGAIGTVYSFSDAWVNGIDWGNFATVIASLAAVVGGLALMFGGMAAGIAAAVASIVLIVMGVKDFISCGPSIQNVILIIGGAVAIFAGLVAIIGPIPALIIALVAAVGAFTAAILLEKPAIMSVTEAQEALNAAKEAAAEAENNYINAVDAAENALKRLENAEKAAGMTGEELYKQVQDGVLDYADMTDAQKELYKAYLDNEKKQKSLKQATDELAKAKKAETIASYEHQLALAKESGNYEDFKKAVVAAFEAGELSADEARDLIGKSMSEMSDDAQQTFMKDLPASIKDGLNPSKYETTRKKIADWFKQAWKDCKDAFKDAGTWFKNIGTKIGEALGTAFRTVVNGILKMVEDTINKPIKGINAALDVINKIPGVNISKINLISVPRLATGGIVSRSTLANIGENGREAVLPLENHTEWMDALADKIAARNNTPTKIVLEVDKKELGWANIHSINDITRQTNKLQLALV
jgi:hypothetical protein